MDYLKIGAVVVVVAALGAFYWNYRSLKEELAADKVAINTLNVANAEWSSSAKLQNESIQALKKAYDDKVAKVAKALKDIKSKNEESRRKLDELMKGEVGHKTCVDSINELKELVK